MKNSLDIFLFLWMEEKLILLSHICSIKYIEPYYPLLFFVSNGNASSTKIMIFGLVGIEKKSVTFLSSSISFVLFFVYFEPSCTYLNLAIFSIVRLNRCHEPRGTVQEQLNRTIFSIARLNRCHELRGTVQEHLNLTIFSIVRLNLAMYFWTMREQKSNYQFFFKVQR